MRRDKIVEVGGKFEVRSKTSGRSFGTYATREEAEERLRQIERFSEDTRQGNRGPEDMKSVKSDEAVRRVDYLEPIHMDPRRSDGALATKDDKTGFLKVTARLTRTGVFEYADSEGNRWGELRTADEVFDADSLASFEMAPVTDNHPPEFVTADNAREYQRGHAGNDIRRDGNFMVATLMITDAELIRKIEDGKCELSNGYTTVAVPERGVTQDGREYEYRQTGIRGNHVAVVDRGRAGSECRIQLDSGDAVMAAPVETSMETKQLSIAGTDYEVPAQVADAIEAERKAAAEAQQKQDGTGAPGSMPDEEEEEMEDKKDSVDTAALLARIDMLEAAAKERADSETARIDARAKLLAKAAEVAPEFKTDGATNRDIMKAVVLSVSPDMQAKLDANADSDGYVRACYDQALQLHADRKKHDNAGAVLAFEAVKADGKREDIDDIYAEYIGKYDMRAKREVKE